MRAVITLSILILIAAPGLAQDRLSSPYRHQSEAGLRGLDNKEIADLKAGNGMGLARAAELNNYPGPRHVLDAISAGKLAVSPDQLERVQNVFDGMNRDAVRLGTEILAEEQRLEARFRAATMTDSDLQSRVTRIAALQGELRRIHLAAHLRTRAILSDTQIARYNELRGYTGSSSEHQGQRHTH